LPVGSVFPAVPNIQEVEASFIEKFIPLLERRGGCGIKKISAKPPYPPQTGWSLTSNCRCERPPSLRPIRRLRAIFLSGRIHPSHEEGNALHSIFHQIAAISLKRAHYPDFPLFEKVNVFIDKS